MDGGCQGPGRGGNEESVLRGAQSSSVLRDEEFRRWMVVTAAQQECTKLVKMVNFVMCIL